MLDLVITRNEPREPPPDFSKLDDAALANTLFVDGGLRLKIVTEHSQTGGANITRSMAIAILSTRYAPAEDRAEEEKTEKAANRSIRFADESTTVEFDTFGSSCALSCAIDFHSAPLFSLSPSPFRFCLLCKNGNHRYTKAEYERVMDPNPGQAHVRELFDANSDLKDQEQEQEVLESIEPLRWHGICLQRKPEQDGFGIILDFIPRLTPGTPDYLFAEVVVVKVQSKRKKRKKEKMR